MTGIAQQCWALIPAAGRGVRLGEAIPKQYLPLAGRTVIECALAPFLRHAAIGGLIVAVAPDDHYWERYILRSQQKPVEIVRGGSRRCHSVANLLEALERQAAPDDWVLVHDAARPCLHMADLELLMNSLADHPAGGILAVPLADTVKRVDADHRIRATVARENLWRALTPQMFRFGLLRAAVRTALREGITITDEAAAMENAGHEVRVVEGRSDNIKITRPADIVMAESILAGF